jgi:hypothetical protein
LSQAGRRASFAIAAFGERLVVDFLLKPLLPSSGAFLTVRSEFTAVDSREPPRFYCKRAREELPAPLHCPPVTAACHRCFVAAVLFRKG